MDGNFAEIIFFFSDKASNLAQNIIHFAGFALVAGFLLPVFRKRIWDIALVSFFAFSALWMLFAESAIYDNNLNLRPIDIFFGVVTVIASIELTRRATGYIIPSMILLALAYVTVLGPYAPGVFRFAGLSFETVLFRAVYGDDALFGNIAFISSGTITIFMIFGAFLLKSGASDFVINLSQLIAGRLRGGAAFVAVIASALTGTISGSAVANTASTGVITIPLMKRTGFRPQFAAAVEASSSIGGQLMPPIMGAGAFVMAANSGIPYSTIAVASILPAALYFASIALVIRVEAVKYALPLLQTEALPKSQFYGGALCFFGPIGVLMYLLINGYSPSYSASLAIILLIGLSWLTPNKLGLAKIIDALYMGIKTACVTAILLVSVGVVINVISTTGVGNAFSLMVEAWSQGNLWIALVLVAVASLILGLGLPTTAAYIILSILAAPAIANIIYSSDIVAALQGTLSAEVQAVILLAAPEWAEAISKGVDAVQAKALLAALPSEITATLKGNLLSQSELLYGLLAAHLVIFWLSQDSNVTPPVCLASFTAAGIAGSPPMKTGVEAWKTAKGLYIITALIGFTALIGDDWYASLHIAGFALFGIYGTVCLLKNHAEGKLGVLLYAVMLLGTVFSFMPEYTLFNVIGTVIVIAVTILSRRKV